MDTARVSPCFRLSGVTAEDARAQPPKPPSRSEPQYRVPSPSADWARRSPRDAPHPQGVSDLSRDGDTGPLCRPCGLAGAPLMPREQAGSAQYPHCLSSKVWTCSV
ncbi:hypothetical protein MVI01_38320 [Myxococcus virescens]|uniref:Uncharacterized protein n=1 Tax=Myxococcus virescens TaxID=83456 RepID=A0A511HER4_9BACT|nr:hypothetical protein MVI01_38320 [Myxococcus virescens]